MGNMKATKDKTEGEHEQVKYMREHVDALNRAREAGKELQVCKLGIEAGADDE